MITTLLTVSVHAPEGYGTWPVCLLFVCLSGLFLGNGKLIRCSEGTNGFGTRCHRTLNASLESNGMICKPWQRSVL